MADDMMTEDELASIRRCFQIPEIHRLLDEHKQLRADVDKMAPLWATHFPAADGIESGTVVEPVFRYDMHSDEGVTVLKPPNGNATASGGLRMMRWRDPCDSSRRNHGKARGQSVTVAGGRSWRSNGLLNPDGRCPVWEGLEVERVRR